MKEQGPKFLIIVTIKVLAYNFRPALPRKKASYSNNQLTAALDARFHSPSFFFILSS